MAWGTGWQDSLEYSLGNEEPWGESIDLMSEVLWEVLPGSEKWQDVVAIAEQVSLATTGEKLGAWFWRQVVKALSSNADLYRAAYVGLGSDIAGL